MWLKNLNMRLWKASINGAISKELRGKTSGLLTNILIKDQGLSVIQETKTASLNFMLHTWNKLHVFKDLVVGDSGPKAPTLLTW